MCALPFGNIQTDMGPYISERLGRLKIEYPKWKCQYYLDTSDYGEKTKTDAAGKPNYYPNGYNFDQIFAAAILRSIDVTQSVEKICNLIKLQSPNYEWLEYMYLEYGNLDPDDEKLIADYISYGYRSTNMGLRNMPESFAQLNPIIDALRPIPNDIVVFRYFGNDLSLGEKIVHGYLSTSLDSNLPGGIARKGKMSMMRIKVPAGAKGFYVPGREKEIIFPHLTKLSILGGAEVTIPDIDRDGYVDWDNQKVIVLFDAQMML